MPRLGRGSITAKATARLERGARRGDVFPEQGPGAVVTVCHDMPSGFVYGAVAMDKRPPGIERSATDAHIDPREPTERQLAVLEAFAKAGSYERTAASTGISPALVRNLLIEIREHYRAATTIQAYRAALAAGDLTAPPG